MALSKFTTNQYADESVTSAKLEDNINVRGDLTVQGNLNIVGEINRDQTSITETVLSIQDSEIKLRSGTPGTYTPNDSDNAFIRVERGSQGDSFVKWDEAANCWSLSNDGTNAYRIITSSETSINFKETGQSDSFSFLVTNTDTTPELKITSLLNKDAVTKFTAQSGYKHSIYLDGDINFNTNAYIGPSVQTALPYTLNSNLRFYTEDSYLFYSPATTSDAKIYLYNAGNGQSMSMYANGNNAKFRLSAATGAYYWYNTLEDVELMNLTAAGSITIPNILTANGVGNNYMAGNLGIGRTPSYKLDVNGNVNITGNITISGTVDGVDVGTHVGDSTIHVTPANKTAWDGKQAALGYTPVNKIGDTMTGNLNIVPAATGGVLTLGNATYWGKVEGPNTLYLNYDNPTKLVQIGKSGSSLNCDVYGTLRIGGTNAVWHAGNFDPSSKSDSGHTHPFDNYQNWKLQADSGTIDDITSTSTVKLVSGNNITLTRTAANTISIAASLALSVNDTPVNGNTTIAVSSNWAYDHAASAAPHTKLIKAGTYTFTGGVIQKSWTHGFTGTYAVVIGCSDPQRHVYYTKNGTSVTIALDEANYTGSIEVSVAIVAATAIV